jgi:hypothetical protein
LLKIELERLGVNISIKCALNALSDVKQIINIYHNEESNSIGFKPVFNNQSEAANTYIKNFNLEKYSISIDNKSHCFDFMK